MLKIYGVPFSVHTRKVIVVALHKHLAYESIPVVPVLPASLPENWRELSPTGRIPALTDADFTLGDSTAICAYLDGQYPDYPVYPASPRDHARALELEQYAGHLFAEVVRPLFHETVVHPRIRNIPTDPNRIQEVLTQLVPRHFGYLERQLQQDFLAGNHPSVADIALCSNLVMYRYLDFDIDTGRFPRLTAHFGRMLQFAAFHEALVREQPTVDSMSLDRSWHVSHR